MAADGFRPGVAEHLAYYVYRLIDPRDGSTFYVGKGTGERIFQHARGDYSEIKDEDTLSLKAQRIGEIQAQGLEVRHVVHRHGIKDEDVAFEIEAAVMDAYPSLTNKAGGHGSGERGLRTVEEINAQYAAELLEVRHPFLLVKVTAKLSDDESTIYEAARYAWVMGRERVQKCDLVLARDGPIVIGAFRPYEWLEATESNFPDKPIVLPPRRGQRWGFNGRWAEPEIREYYVGRRVPECHLRSTGNPIKYCDPE